MSLDSSADLLAPGVPSGFCRGRAFLLSGLLLGASMFFVQSARAAVPGAIARQVPRERSTTLRAVGMEARGIDAWTAWRYRDRLDVRDNLNRPVSVRKIESQVKAAMGAAAREAAAFSAVPRCAALLDGLDRMLDSLLLLRRALFNDPWEHVQALPWPLKLEVRWLIPLLVLGWASGWCGFLRRIGLAFHYCAANRISLPLRC